MRWLLKNFTKTTMLPVSGCFVNIAKYTATILCQDFGASTHGLRTSKKQVEL
jgi:hypothetical protein